MAIQLKVVQDTVFKQTTEDAVQLPPEDKVSVPAGTVLNIHSWKAVDRSYLKIALMGDFLGNPPRNTWYVHIPHIQLIQPPSLKITRNTIFKQSTASSAQLPAQDKVSIAIDRIINLQSWATAPNNHYKLSLLWDSLGTPPRNTWYIYTPDFEFITTQQKFLPFPNQSQKQAAFPRPNS